MVSDTTSTYPSVVEYPFAAWETFYVIVGGAAAALTGLQFVVIVLGSEANQLSQPALKAFGTPTIVNFGAALMQSLILGAPWHVKSGAAVCLALFGVGGLFYHLHALWHARRQTAYQPVAEDWFWFYILPTIAYVASLVSACMLTTYTTTALFTAGGVAIILLFTGIHNAWDAATWIALGPTNGDTGGEDAARPAGGDAGAPQA